MQYITMSYKGFEFEANPSSVKVSYSKKIAQKTVPYSDFICSEVSGSQATISGEGSFTGSNALKKAYEMLRIFNKKESDYLFCPSAEPIKAFFSDLDISYSCKENKVDYCFRFVQDSENKAPCYKLGYTIADKDENAFDVADRTGISIEKIVSVNELEDLFAIKEGDKIWLV